ncbi:hypothetical protein LCGC14_2200280 [marine sediment metagenome]|uniref:Band 7 domain-containing protein n=1 Tax=marine sediment metagenome TaxID=412755 RepID=A0A0F9DGX5_9ZZZZ
MIAEILGLLVVLAVLGGIIALALKTVRPTERALVERFGKFHRYCNAGLTFIIPFVDRIYYVNITEQMVDAAKQDVITGDNLNASVDAQIYFKVKDDEENVKRSQYSVDNYYRQIVAIARTTLRDLIGKTVFTEVNSKRGQLNVALEQELEKQTGDWGIKVVRTEIKEIEPPEDVQETMNEIIKADNTKVAAKDYATATETKADGVKRAAIKEAEGTKQSQVLVADGKAQAIKLVNQAADKYFVGNAKELEKLRVTEAALSKNTKFVVPSNSPLSDLIAAFTLNKGFDEKGKGK